MTVVSIFYLTLTVSRTSNSSIKVRTSLDSIKINYIKGELRPYIVSMRKWSLFYFFDPPLSLICTTGQNCETPQLSHGWTLSNHTEKKKLHCTDCIKVEGRQWTQISFICLESPVSTQNRVGLHQGGKRKKFFAESCTSHWKGEKTQYFCFYFKRVCVCVYFLVCLLWFFRNIQSWPT